MHCLLPSTTFCRHHLCLGSRFFQKRSALLRETGISLEPGCLAGTLVNQSFAAIHLHNLLFEQYFLLIFYLAECQSKFAKIDPLSQQISSHWIFRIANTMQKVSPHCQHVSFSLGDGKQPVSRSSVFACIRVSMSFRWQQKNDNPFFWSSFHAFKSDHVATSAKLQSCLKLARSNDCGGAFESLLQAMPFFKCFWLDTAARCFLDTFFLAAENLDGRIFDPGMEAWKVGSCQPSGKEERKKLDAANASGQPLACGVDPHANSHEWISWENHIYTHIYIYMNIYVDK